MGIAMIHRAAATAGLVLSAVLVPAIAHGQATMRGILYDDATGLPVRGTVMLVDPATNAAVAHVTTDTLGQFLLKVGDGVYRLAAVTSGYTSVLSAEIPLALGEAMTLRVPIRQSGDPEHRIAVLEHVRPDARLQKSVEQNRRFAGQGNYAGRVATGAGLHFDRTSFSRTNANTLGDFLQTVPGLRVGDPNSTTSMEMSRSAGLNSLVTRGSMASQCHVGWFVDGHRMDLPGRTDPMTDGLGAMQLDIVEAVEVFRGISEIPPEFAAPDLRCGAIAVWTRRG